MTATPSGPLTIYRARADDIKIKTLLYGNPGAGKTTLCLTANDHPALAPALVLNFEGGLLSVVGRGDVDVVDITEINDLERVFWYFENDDPAVSRFKTLIVDSGSELYNRALREVVEGNIARRRNRANDPDDVQLEDYGKTGNMVFRLFSMFRDLPRHVLVTAHAKFIYPQGGNENISQPTEVRPAFSPGICTRLEGIFDNVHFLYTYEEEVEVAEGIKESVTHRALLTQASGPYHGKTRGPRYAAALGSVVIDPTLPEMYNLLVQTEGGQEVESLPQPVEREESEELEESLTAATA